jgi:hypothetical protein
VVDATTFNEHIGQKQRNRRSPKTEPRTLTTWYNLQHHTGFCTVPGHEDVQRQLKPGQQSYRQQYPTRHLFRIGDLEVCRDCFQAGADKQ